MDTYMLSHINAEKAKPVLSVIELLSDETAIICFIPNDTYWWVLTDERLIVKESQITYLKFQEINSIELSEIFEGEQSKSELASIDITTASSKFKLKVEKGSWHVIYNILKFLISKES